MSETVSDYVKTEMRTFAEHPFHEVDSLVLSQLSYIHLENEDGETVAPDKEGVLITQNAGMVLDFGKEEMVLIQNL